MLHVRYVPRSCGRPLLPRQVAAGENGRRATSERRTAPCSAQAQAQAGKRGSTRRSEIGGAKSFPSGVHAAPANNLDVKLDRNRQTKCGCSEARGSRSEISHSGGLTHPCSTRPPAAAAVTCLLRPTPAVTRQDAKERYLPVSEAHEKARITINVAFPGERALASTSSPQRWGGPNVLDRHRRPGKTRSRSFPSAKPAEANDPWEQYVKQSATGAWQPGEARLTVGRKGTGRLDLGPPERRRAGAIAVLENVHRGGLWKRLLAGRDQKQDKSNPRAGANPAPAGGNKLTRITTPRLLSSHSSPQTRSIAGVCGLHPEGPF